MVRFGGVTQTVLVDSAKALIVDREDGVPRLASMLSRGLVPPRKVFADRARAPYARAAAELAALGSSAKRLAWAPPIAMTFPPRTGAAASIVAVERGS